MRIEFTKMTAAGNDYVYVDCTRRESLPFDPGKLARAVSPRRTSVGADGLVLICADGDSDARMRMFNADGSEGLMCGNALRCVTRYVFDRRICVKRNMEIATASGVRRTSVSPDGEITAEMGKAVFRRDLRAAIRGRVWEVTALSVGNPHAVVFGAEPALVDLGAIGPAFENAPVFGERVNAEFVKKTGADSLEMRVWERGSGETLSCGTGACAAAAASVRRGLFPAGSEIGIRLPGGELRVRCTPEYDLFLSGPADYVYDGVFYYDQD